MVVEHLSTLVAFDTVSHKPVTPLASWLAGRLQDLGLQVRLVEDPHQPGKHDVFATAGPEGTDGIVLTGHMDVVPTEGQPWTCDPFSLTTRGDRLLGRGTADMKGFLAATLSALERIDLARLDRELVLAWTYDEEVGCLGSAHLVHVLQHEGRPVPTACLVGEPTDFQILRMHAGHVAVRVVVEGEAAHSSRPDLGVNAIEGAARVIDEVRALALELRHAAPPDLPEIERPWVAMNVGTIQGGAAVNVVPDRCVVELGYRPLPGQQEPDVLHQLQERIRRIDGPWTLRVERLHGISPLLTPANTPLEGLLRRWASRADVGAAGFATDGGNLARLGMNPLVFGPGSIDVAHKADEWVDTGALHRAVDVVEAVVRARCLGQAPR